jgi:hypothetical protein
MKITYTNYSGVETVLYSLDDADELYNRAIEVYHAIIYNSMKKDPRWLYFENTYGEIISKMSGLMREIEYINVIINDKRIPMYNAYLTLSMFKKSYVPFIRELGVECDVLPAIRQVREELAHYISDN